MMHHGDHIYTDLVFYAIDINQNDIHEFLFEDLSLPKSFPKNHEPIFEGSKFPPIPFVVLFLNKHTLKLNYTITPYQTSNDFISWIKD